MRELFVSLRTRGVRVLGTIPMYRLILISLIVLSAVAFVVSFGGRLSAQPLALALSAAVLLASVAIVDAIGHRLTRRPQRFESGAITALILLFILFPTTDSAGLALLALAGAAASASKYLLVWRGRHIFNPAAAGAAVITMTGWGSSMWWVGTPLLAGLVLALGLAVAWRAEKLRLAAIFVVIAMTISFARTMLTAAQFSIPTTPGDALMTVAFSSPILFAGLFMITEPLTLPPRRGQQIAVAALAGILVGWPVAIGPVVLLPEVAILLANLLAFVLAIRSRRGLTLHVASRRSLTPTVVEVEFEEAVPETFVPGQYVELEVAHRRADSRGSRREFSIASAPGQPLRIAYREPVGRQSSFKRALAGLAVGERVDTTGLHGDFALPAPPERPVLLVAAGIGITPFVAQLLAEPQRDVVLIYVASTIAELAYAAELSTTSARIIVVAPDVGVGEALPSGWQAFSQRLTADIVGEMVPDLAHRDALISGPPALIATLAPALRSAKSLRTDAFAGY